MKSDYFCVGAVYPIVYDADICRRTGGRRNSGGGEIRSGDSLGRSPCRRGAGQRPAGGWRTGYGERPGTGWIDPCGVPDPPQR